MDTTQPDLLNEEPQAGESQANEADSNSSDRQAKPGKNGDSSAADLNHAEESISKSERIRRYIHAHPEARNTEIVAALEEHGIKYQDVGNVRSQEKRKAAKKASPVKRRRSVSSKVEEPTNAAPAPGPAVSHGTVSVDALQSAADFVKQAGGIDQAQAILDLIRQIQSI
ncbi:hypothetical protein [Rhodopirellula halodulae]|uniref:hypothetical protein n=1 Tax=Rhodopirellula halodulae TaxID=2894198 RepID=UPI001E60A453|nr:hypothetical protein [Rhodopirellula sp. JC737]MCC9654489.1 hypothetical protein [Rhodopirellula sp. JC737]